MPLDVMPASIHVHHVCTVPAEAERGHQTAFMHTICVPCLQRQSVYPVCRGRERASDALGLVLQMLVSCCVGAGN